MPEPSNVSGKAKRMPNLPPRLAAIRQRLAASRMHRANEPITSPKLLLDDLAYALRVLAVAEEVVALAERQQKFIQMTTDSTGKYVGQELPSIAPDALTHWTQVTQEGTE